MNYIVYIIQEGEGCDYTIGCGRTIFPLKADNLKHAEERIALIIEGDPDDEKGLKHWTNQIDGYNDDTSLISCIIYEISDSKVIDLDSIYKEIQEKKANEFQENERERELLLLEKLKEKYENK